MRQTVDKTNGFRQFDESFGQAFSKACAVKGAEPLSPLASGEIFFTAFSFGNFSFAPMVSKEKWIVIFVLFNELLLLQQSLSVV
jgi:hypothetical protein